SELATAVVSSESAKPTCRYTLHKESSNGPLVKLAQVGDLIYHVWDCPSDVYGMMIHDCSIVDGQGNNHTVIDSQGELEIDCSLTGYTFQESSNGPLVKLAQVVRPTPVSLIRANHIPEHTGDLVESDVVQLKREMRRRDAEAVDVDISSPELTIIDKDIGQLFF
ncbi:hypothetical protein Angca_006898, partial [Angiostrongylus cantonensis]